MSSSNYRFTLNMQDEHSQVSLPVRLNDTDRKLYITIADGGKPLFIEKGCLAYFFGKKADGNEIATSCIIEGNSVIRYDFTDQTASYPGIVSCEIRLYDKEGKLVTSPRFIMVVDERVIFDNDVVSTSHVTLLDELLGTEATRQSNEATRQGNEMMRDDYEKNRNEAEYTRSYNESMRESNEAHRNFCEEGRSEAEHLRDEAEQSRISAEESRAYAEGLREEAESRRNEAENYRLQDESNREYNEASRVSAENLRAYDESKRVEVEKARVTAEKARVVAETSRENRESTRRIAEEYRGEDENKRNAKEQERRDAEKTRVSNETSRVSAETERLTAEETRISNEDIRIANETERIANDKVREDKFANAIKVTEIGEIVRVDDVSPYMHNVKCKVKSDDSNIDLSSVQVTRCGKNLISYPFPERTLTRYGITFTDNGDGSVTANGTATAAAHFIFKGKSNLPVGKYALSGCPLGGGVNTYYMTANGFTIIKSDTGSGGVIEVTEDSAQTNFVILVSSGATLNNVVFKPQLEAGTVATEYEPYKGETYKPLSDGTVEGIKSVSPTMTIFTDTAGVEIEIEYNRDSNQLADKKLSSTSTHPVQNKIITDNFARVDNEFDALNKRVDSIDEVSKGAVEAKSFMTYADMLAEINAESKDRYKVGQHFIIQAIGVPDLYIYGVSDTSSTYVYTNDKAVVDATTEGYIQVGYYLISQLETQKVDLTDYAKKDQVPVIRASQKENGAYTLTITMGVE